MNIGNEVMPNVQCGHRKNISKQEFFIAKSLCMVEGGNNLAAKTAY